MADHSPRIAIMDSGLGGITICDALRKQIPHASLSYCSDNQAFPYGTKTEAELVGRVSQVLNALNTSAQADIIIIACNTASTVALPKIRSQFEQPVIGVVPAIKPAALVSGSDLIGLLATPGTIERSYTQDLIEQFGSGHQWIKVGSSELVELAEKKMQGKTITIEEVKACVADLGQYDSEQMDTVVLGCTHFPLVRSELAQCLPGILHWVDSTDAIVRRTEFWLHELGFYGSSCKSDLSGHSVFFTDLKSIELDNMAELIKTQQFNTVDQLRV